MLKRTTLYTSTTKYIEGFSSSTLTTLEELRAKTYSVKILCGDNKIVMTHSLRHVGNTC